MRMPAVLVRLLDGIERATGLPPRFIVPILGCLTFLYVGFLGLSWDLGWHIDVGRDRLIAPPHVLIVIGLQSTLVWALLHGILTGPRVRGERTSASGRISFAPGAVQLVICSMMATIAFPLDAAWHYMFGKDNTLWGPTHVLMIAGGTMCAVGLQMMHRQATAIGEPRRWVRWLRLDIQIASALLLGLAGLHGEFDYGAPQFPMHAQPVLIAATAAFALCYARALLGRGGALKVVAWFLVVRWTMYFVVGTVVGYNPPQFPQFIAEALLVEAAALAMPRVALRWSLLAGLLLGTVGVAVEFWWSTVFMPTAWIGHAMWIAVPCAIVASCGAAVLGVRIGHAMGVGEREVRISTRAVWLAVLAVVVGMGIVVARQGGDGTRAVITSQPDGSGRTTIGVTLTPHDAARNAELFQVMSLYGKHPRELTAFRRVGPGRYEARHVPIGTEAEPWTSFFRLERGSHMLSGTPMSPKSDVGVRPEVLYRGALVRENFSPEVKDAPQWLTDASYLLCALLFAYWGVLIGRALRLQETTDAGGVVVATA